MWLLCGDLHLTDQARDAYRFGIFNWLAKQQAKRSTAATFLAGDITDLKDRHSATLVNAIVDGLKKLKPPVYIVMGNHDYLRDKTNPFFKFLNHIEGIQFVTDPLVVRVGKPMGLLPHYRTQAEFDDAFRNVMGAKPAALLTHQTFEGAIAESGVRLSGLTAPPMSQTDLPLGVWAGDVHRPQTQGDVTYVGCPYNVRFGDNFDPRCLYISSDSRDTDLNYPAPRKWSLTVRGPENIRNNKELYEGDQVKLTIEMAREEAVEWQDIKRKVVEACKKLKLEVHGVTMEVKTVKPKQRVQAKGHSTHVETLEDFCKSENVAGSIRKAGRELLGGN